MILLLDVVILMGVVSFAAYKMSTRLVPLGPLEQKRKIDPQTQILEYYRQYPDRYIRITKESWRYDELTRSAYHFLTLRNTATVSYSEIQLRFSYEDANGKLLKTETVAIPDTVAALGTIEVKKIRVKNVPSASARVASTVIKASIH